MPSSRSTTSLQTPNGPPPYPPSRPDGRPRPETELRNSMLCGEVPSILGGHLVIDALVLLGAVVNARTAEFGIVDCV